MQSYEAVYLQDDIDQSMDMYEHGFLEEPLSASSPIQNKKMFSVKASASETEPVVTAKRSKLHSNSKYKKKHKTDEEILEKIGDRLEVFNKTEDRYDIAGKNFAAKLRELPNNQRIYAEKLINDVLFEAELSNLNRNSSVNIQLVQPRSNNNETHSMPQIRILSDEQILPSTQGQHNRITSFYNAFKYDTEQ